MGGFRSREIESEMVNRLFYLNSKKSIPENKQEEEVTNMMVDDVELDELAKNLDHETDHDKLNRLIEEALSAMKEASELALKLKAMQLPEKKVPWYKRLFGGK